MNLANLGALSRTAVYKGRYPKGFDRERAVQRARRPSAATPGPGPRGVVGTIKCEDQIEFPFSWEGRPLCMISATLDRVLVRPDQPNAPRGEGVQDDQAEDRPTGNIRCALCGPPRLPGLRDLRHGDRLDAEDGTVSTDTIEGRELRGLHPVIFQAAVKVIHEKQWDACPSERCTFCLRPRVSEAAIPSRCGKARRCSDLTEKIPDPAPKLRKARLMPTSRGTSTARAVSVCIRGPVLRPDPYHRQEREFPCAPSVEGPLWRHGTDITHSPPPTGEKSVSLAYRRDARLPRIHRRRRTAQH